MAFGSTSVTTPSTLMPSSLGVSGAGLRAPPDDICPPVGRPPPPLEPLDVPFFLGVCMHSPVHRELALCQYLCPVGHDRYRMFKMSRYLAIRRHHRPSIVKGAYLLTPHVHHRLNGKRHSTLQAQTCSRSPIVRHIYFRLVHAQPHPVSV